MDEIDIKKLKMEQVQNMEYVNKNGIEWGIKDGISKLEWNRMRN